MPPKVFLLFGVSNMLLVVCGGFSLFRIHLLFVEAILVYNPLNLKEHTGRKGDGSGAMGAANSCLSYLFLFLEGLVHLSLP